MQQPVIAIVGRPNVGKSSLLNALAGKLISIVQDMPGVTRDRISTPLCVHGKWVELVDTGGYGFDDPDQLTEHIKHQIEMALTRSDLVLFVVDTLDGLTSADESIAQMLRRKGLKCILVANKADGPNADMAVSDFARLGLGQAMAVSAIRERNLDLIIEAIAKNVDLSQAPDTMPTPQLMMAIVGKRNAGKSTLVNSIAQAYEGGGDRVIVSEVPGTTRDSVDVLIEKEGKALVVIDTAGVRKKRHMMTNDIEYYSFHRAQRSVRRADVTVLLIDGAEPISEPDKKLAQYIAEQMKPVLIVVNKWDLVRKTIADKRPNAEAKELGDSALMEEYREYIRLELRHLDYAPIAFITARDSKRIESVIELSQHLYRQANERLGTGRLNNAIRTVLTERSPSTHSGRRAKVFYATQIGVAPPTIVLFVNNPMYLSEPYQRFMINRFRQLLPYPEVPIKLILRARSGRTSGLSLDEGDAEEAKAREFDPAAHPVGPVRPKGKMPSKPSAKLQQGPRRPPEPKPRPRATPKRGAKRGTRPR